MNEFRLPNEKPFPAYAWPGGYPLFYVDGHNSVLCPECAEEYREDDDIKFRPHFCDINYEIEWMYCDQCSKEIECAYPNDGIGEND